MRPGEVEQWVARVVGRLEQGLRVEDDRVECKRHLPTDPFKAARRVAGHANQVREDRILWVIGVDEEASPPVVGLAPGEPDAAAWWVPVEARFADEVSPSPTWVNVSTESGKSVLGLGFDTSRPPYVIKVPSDIPSREVPWREGTHVRTASRFDLLRLLVPLRDRPTVTVLDGYLQVSEETRRGGREGPAVSYLKWYGQVKVYVECESLVVFPDHRCSGRVSFGSAGEVPLQVRPSAPSQPQASQDRESRARFMSLPPTALVAEQGDEQVVVRGPSPIRLGLLGHTDLDRQALIKPTGDLIVHMQTGGPSSVAVDLTAALNTVPAEELGPNRLAQWTIQTVHDR